MFIRSKLQEIESRIDGFSSVIQLSGGGASTASSALAAATALEELEGENREDYPSVKFWTRESWQEDSRSKQGDSDASATTKDKDIPAKYSFLQYNDGTPVTLARLNQMRSAARSIYEEMLKNGTAPMSWDSQVPAESRDLFYARMEKKYPELRLCEDHWKSNQIAIIQYPGWKQARRKQFSALEAPSKAVKVEDTTSISPIGDTKTPSMQAPNSSSKKPTSTTSAPPLDPKGKRPASASLAPTAKRIKLATPL